MCAGVGVGLMCVCVLYMHVYVCVWGGGVWCVGVNGFNLLRLPFFSSFFFNNTLHKLH